MSNRRVKGITYDENDLDDFDYDDDDYEQDEGLICLPLTMNLLLTIAWTRTEP